MTGSVGEHDALAEQVGFGAPVVASPYICRLLIILSVDMALDGARTVGDALAAAMAEHVRELAAQVTGDFEPGGPIPVVRKMDWKVQLEAQLAANDYQ